MQRLVKRSLFAVGAPFALATVVGGSLAFAANSSSNGQQQQPHTWEHQHASFESQASPTASPDGNGFSGCDHGDGGASANSDSNADVAGQL